AGKTLFEAGKLDAARDALAWAADKSSVEALQAVARLRLSGMDIDAKDYAKALQQLQAPMPKAFAGLTADRKGDALMAQGQKDEAKAEYLNAGKALGERVEYGQLVEVRLASLGVDVSTLSGAAEVVR